MKKAFRPDSVPSQKASLALVFYQDRVWPSAFVRVDGGHSGTHRRNRGDPRQPQNSFRAIFTGKSSHRTQLKTGKAGIVAVTV
jgi:hypothetical protein